MQADFFSKESSMARTKITLAIIVPLSLLALIISAAQDRVSFSPYVDGEGKIARPADFRANWVHLGTWVVTSQAATGPDQGGTSHANGLHEVYTQPESLKIYRKTGSWPDGTVLILEVRPIQWDDLPTGHVMYAGDETEVSVMIKDNTNRFKGRPHWGDGWGWALFQPKGSPASVSTDYKNDCLSCHEVAKDADFVFVQGYPILK